MTASSPQAEPHATSPGSGDRPVLTVGVDGSETGNRALGWAIDEALRRGANLSLVSVWQFPPAAYAAVPAFLDDLQKTAEDRIDDALAQVNERAPGLACTSTVVEGPPARMLITAAKASLALVVGSRGHGGFTSMLLGSTSDALARHALGPVVVVRATEHSGGPVVVGVDGSAASSAAFRFGLEAAAGRGVPVVAVSAWRGLDTVLSDTIEHDSSAQTPWKHAHAVIDQAAAEWSARFPAVRVEHRVVQGHPVDALLDSSAEASLLVVGHRGRGGFAGLMLGSVSRGVLHHAACPVAVVRG